MVEVTKQTATNDQLCHHHNAVQGSSPGATNICWSVTLEMWVYCIDKRPTNGCLKVSKKTFLLKRQMFPLTQFNDRSDVVFVVSLAVLLCPYT